MHVRVHNVFHAYLLNKYVYDTKYVVDWSLLQVEHEGDFSPEPTHIVDKREVQPRKCTVLQLKVQWKHFEVDEATWENEATMRKDYPALFHDAIMSPQNTKDGVFLSREGCNIPNFGPNTYRHVPIDYDVLFLYQVEDPTAYEHDDSFYILGVSQLLMIYVYACLSWAWTLKHMIDDIFCVERGALEHLSD